jgi:hypothetical protein
MINNYNNEKSNQELVKLREELTMQEKYIRKLRNKVEFLKSANTKGNVQFIVKEED